GCPRYRFCIWVLGSSSSGTVTLVYPELRRVYPAPRRDCAPGFTFGVGLSPLLCLSLCSLCSGLCELCVIVPLLRAVRTLLSSRSRKAGPDFLLPAAFWRVGPRSGGIAARTMNLDQAQNSATRAPQPQPSPCARSTCRAKLPETARRARRQTPLPSIRLPVQSPEQRPSAAGRQAPRARAWPPASRKETRAMLQPSRRTQPPAWPAAQAAARSRGAIAARLPEESSSSVPRAWEPPPTTPFRCAQPPAARCASRPVPWPFPAPIQTHRISPRPAAACYPTKADAPATLPPIEIRRCHGPPSRPGPATPAGHRST